MIGGPVDGDGDDFAGGADRGDAVGEAVAIAQDGWRLCASHHAHRLVGAELAGQHPGQKAGLILTKADALQVGRGLLQRGIDGDKAAGGIALGQILRQRGHERPNGEDQIVAGVGKGDDVALPIVRLHRLDDVQIQVEGCGRLLQAQVDALVQAAIVDPTAVGHQSNPQRLADARPGGQIGDAGRGDGGGQRIQGALFDAGHLAPAADGLQSRAALFAGEKRG
ncbi:MAG: hypothetical protein V9H69_13880 [Anaerolineae bacterium]